MLASMRDVLLVPLLVLVGCDGGSRTADLTLTLPNGSTQTKALGPSGGFLFDGSTRATISFPDIAEWNKDVPLGVSLQLGALQPGRYGTSGRLHLGEDTVARAKSVTYDVSIERVRWQNDGAFPFRVEGTFTGTTAENHKLEGRFSTTQHDCSDKVLANSGSWLCGLPFPSSKYTEQTWTIDSWVTEGDCPDAIFKRFAGGREYTVGPRFASAGGQRQLQCVGTYANAYKAICGANEENVTADGCTWSVTAYSTPGVLNGVQPRMAIFAGTTGSTCPPKVCAMYPREFIHKSGATPQD